MAACAPGARVVELGAGTWEIVGMFDAGGSAFDSEVWADATVLNGNYDRPPNLYQSATARLASTDDFDALRLQCIQVQRDAPGCADQLRRRQPAAPLRVVEFLDTLVEYAGVQHPPLHVAAAVNARHANVLTDGERNRAAALLDFLRKLQSGRRSADNQRGTVVELPEGPTA